MRSRRIWHIIAFDSLFFRVWTCVWGVGLGLRVRNGVVQAYYSFHLINNEHSTFNQAFKSHLDFNMCSSKKCNVREPQVAAYVKGVDI